MKTITYKNKAGQTVIAEYEHKDFGNGKILNGKKTIVNAKINGKTTPPVYLSGHVGDSEVKTAISSIRANRPRLK